MEAGVTYDVVDREDPEFKIGWIKDGKFFNAIVQPPAYDGDVVGSELHGRVASPKPLILAKIVGLVMTRDDGGKVFDLVPRK